MSELRWVSVLFVDLTGDTALSENMTADEVRELLSGYFDLSRTVVTRYGGRIEKFVGDAVVAVWSSIVAHDDDAHRAVCAALEIVGVVPGYGDTRGLTGVAARAGVVTGEVMTWASTGEGIVAGDRVNTAARVQAVAAPSTVLVDEHTRGATEAAVAYTATGGHALKGKADPVPLWRADRVVARAGGAVHADGLETAFLGRARDLGGVKDLFHAAVETGRARLVMVVGPPGVGKTRLGWEVEKYLDGIAGTVLWHRGRCLSYGEGVALWALKQLIRQRLELAEEDGDAEVSTALEQRLPRWMPDADERAFVAPRLAVLLGTGTGGRVAQPGVRTSSHVVRSSRRSPWRDTA